jgi:hypothetical protein
MPGKQTPKGSWPEGESIVTEEEIAARFGGAERAEFRLIGTEVSDIGTVVAIGAELGYRIVAYRMLSQHTYAVGFERDDSPGARALARRAEEMAHGLGGWGPYLRYCSFETPGNGPREAAMARLALVHHRKLTGNGHRGVVAVGVVISLAAGAVAGAFVAPPLAAVALLPLGGCVYWARRGPAIVGARGAREAERVRAYEAARAGRLGVPPG